MALIHEKNGDAKIEAYKKQVAEATMGNPDAYKNFIDQVPANSNYNERPNANSYETKLPVQTAIKQVSEMNSGFKFPRAEADADEPEERGRRRNRASKK